MINEIINEQGRYRAYERAEDEYLLLLRTRAEGVGSIQYGDDASHGSGGGDKMERATIKLSDVRTEIAKKRRPRFKKTADLCDAIYEALEAEAARIMVLFIVDGLTYREIADKTGWSIGWVSETVKKSKDLLKWGL